MRTLAPAFNKTPCRKVPTPGRARVLRDQLLVLSRTTRVYLDDTCFARSLVELLKLKEFNHEMPLLLGARRARTYNRNGTRRHICLICGKTSSEPRDTIGNHYLSIDTISFIATLLAEGNSMS